MVTLTLYAQQPRALYELGPDRVVGCLGTSGRRCGVLPLRRGLLELVLRVFRPASQTAVVVGRPGLVAIVAVTRLVRFDGHECQYAGRRIAVGRSLRTHRGRIEKINTKSKIKNRLYAVLFESMVG